MTDDYNSKYGSSVPFNIVAASLFGVASVAYLLFKLKKSNYFSSPLRKQHIEIINTVEECYNAINKIKLKTVEYKVVGFDCEWVTKNGLRHPIALLQLASLDGFCALFRLSEIQHIPRELKNFLEDGSILKVGISPIDDAKYLSNDYAVKVNGFFDLRYLSLLISETPGGLSSMTAKHLQIKMDKNWRIRCSDWEIDVLSQKQIQYAALDALAGVMIFKKLTNQILRQSKLSFWFWDYQHDNWKDILDICAKFINTRYHFINSCGAKNTTPTFKNVISPQQRERLYESKFKPQSRNYTHMTQSKIPYDNCYMTTPDDEILCTCEKKKAEWYVDKDLAEVTCKDPFTIRLKFQPAGKSVGNVGRFYQSPRENCCVVCGQSHSCIKKNVVPREYRKLFPSIMKEHSSHDVLLLCISCHQISNINDQMLRVRLVEICDAPLGDKNNSKFQEYSDSKKIRSAARALLKNSTKNNIPLEKVKEFENIIFQFYPNTQVITTDFLIYLSNIDIRLENPTYQSHGETVVNYFRDNLGGLLNLERMWREHFVRVMNPKFMPALWSIDHTESRLKIRAREGRINHEDLLIAGLSVNSEKKLNC